MKTGEQGSQGAGESGSWGVGQGFCQVSISKWVLTELAPGRAARGRACTSAEADPGEGRWFTASSLRAGWLWPTLLTSPISRDSGSVWGRRARAGGGWGRRPRARRRIQARAVGSGHRGARAAGCVFCPREAQRQQGGMQKARRTAMPRTPWETRALSRGASQRPCTRVPEDERERGQSCCSRACGRCACASGWRPRRLLTDASAGRDPLDRRKLSTPGREANGLQRHASCRPLTPREQAARLPPRATGEGNAGA